MGSGKLEGRSAIVTGAARGIGLGIARRLVADGAQVLMTDVLADLLEQAAKDIDAPDGVVATLAMDLRDRDAPQRLMSAADAAFGKVDILVNNAGVAISGTIEQFSDEQWDHGILLDVTVPFRIARTVVPAMAKRGYGRVVNISSMNATIGMRGDACYSVAKAGLEALTRSISVDYGMSGVTANTVAPGTIETPLNRDILDSLDPDSAMIKMCVDNKPIPGRGKPEDIAAAVAFLVSEDAKFVSGQVVGVDGGMVKTTYVPDPPGTQHVRYLPKN